MEQESFTLFPQGFLYTLRQNTMTISWREFIIGDFLEYISGLYLRYIV